MQALASGLFRTRHISHSQDPAAGLNIAAKEEEVEEEVVTLDPWAGADEAAGALGGISALMASNVFCAFSNAALKLNAWKLNK